MTDWRAKARRARHYYVALNFRFNRGMSFIQQVKRILVLPVYVGMFNLTILNPLGYNIPAQYIIYLLPVVAIGAVIWGHLDLTRLNIWQYEGDYIKRRIDPFMQELMGRIKRIEARQAKEHGYDDYDELYEWTDKDFKGGFEKYGENKSTKKSRERI